MYTAVKPLSKYLQCKSVRIYDAVFMLHSKCTVALLLTCTFLLSAKQYFGDPIQCVSDHKNLDYVHLYCWTFGTYIVGVENAEDLDYMYSSIQSNYEHTVKRHLEENLLYIAGNLAESANGNIPTTRTYLRYYQWVALVLLLQAFVFYLPALLWKIWEAGRLKQLCTDLSNPLITKKQLQERMADLVEYFSNDHKRSHYLYVARYIFCEVFNFAVSIANIMLLEVFLGGFWSRYIDALNTVSEYNWKEWNRITSRIFPKVAKCELMIFGHSGSPSVYDNLCLLPLNILNEKIFAILWVWFLVVALLDGIKLLYRLFTILHSNFRFQLLGLRIGRSVTTSKLKSALNNYTYGDCFVLMRVGNNIGPELFQQLLENVYHRKVSKSPVNAA